MTLEQIESKLAELENIIKSLQSSLSNYVTQSALKEVSDKANETSTNLNQLQESIKTLGSFTSRLSQMKDVKFGDLVTGDVLYYDTNLQMWINYNSDNMTGSSSGVSSLSQLADVVVGTLSDGQVLTYSLVDGKWINKTITIPGPGSSGITMDTVWEELGKSGTQRIHPDHIKGDLSVTSVTTTGNMTAGGKISAVGNITSQSGVAALKEHEA